MAVIFAQPHSFDVCGFYFSSAEEYFSKYNENLPLVEEYELQFIDGTDFESLIFYKYLMVWMNMERYFKIIDDFKDSITETQVIALSYLFEYEDLEIEKALEKMDDIIVFEGTAKDYAMEFFGDQISDQLGKLAFYFDYEFLGQDMLLNSEIHAYRKNSIDYIVSP